MKLAARIALLKECPLYGIIDFSYTTPANFLAIAQIMIDSGIKTIQLRAKKEIPNSITRYARKLVDLCRPQQVLVIVNDYPAIARTADADGVHIGQDDGTLANVTKQLSQEMLIGRSTHSLEQAKTAYEEGAHYIGFGPLHATNTKPGRAAIGYQDIKQVTTDVSCHIPVFCIGGINEQNLPTVLQAGAQRFVVVSDLLLAASPAKKIQQLLTIYQQHITHYTHY